MNFKLFADAINKKFLELSALGTLLRVNTSKEALWETYQSAYTPEDNPIFRERKVHKCNTCYSFIKRLGPVVGVVNGQLDTIWNVKGLPEPYQDVADKMHTFVIKHAISSVFLSDEKLAGKEFNIEESATGPIKWEHFYADIDQAFISQSVAADAGEISSTVEVFNRALNEFSIETLQSVIDLCDSIYRGEEFKPTVESFLRAKLNYESAPNKAVFIWTQHKFYPARIRNTAIGTLIIDVQAGEDLEVAVAKYEKVVAPTNYKRTTAIVTEAMKKQAVEKIDELGLRPSLPRRHAELTDISINNVLFANSDSQAVMKDSLDILIDATVTKTAEVPTKAVEVTIDQFLNKVLPGSKNIEVLLENRHTPNLVSLVAPVNADAPNMLKWNNNFSWSYAGEVTDSMKELVKAAGGNVTGDVRFSIQWNEAGQDASNDLDAHCQCPEGHIYYGDKMGRLDVDIQRPGNKTAVENITWPSIAKMRSGVYKFYVNNYSGRNTNGFRAQLEILGEVIEYNHSKSVTTSVSVVTLTIKDGKVVSVENLVESSSSSKTIWDVDTKQYHKVTTIMLSPNHWDGQSIGNKHYFFMLDGCTNPDSVRGFYNEFLSDELRPHRKFFEVLSSSMKCTPSKEQLSGLGFSSTQSNELYAKVDNRPYKITF